MKSAINLVSLGEIKVGMYVMVLHEKIHERYYTDHNGETQVQTYCPSPVPWFKGIPYQVVGIAGPIIAVKSLPQPQANVGPVNFLDTNMVQLAEIPKKFYTAYFDASQPKPKKPRASKQFNQSTTDAELANTLKNK